MLKIFRLISWHDIGEIEAGDVLGFFKTAADRQRDLQGNQLGLQKMLAVLRTEVSSLLAEYEAQQTPEAQFVKALDKVEVIFEIPDDNYRQVFTHNQTTTKHNLKNQYPYVGNFPYIERFCAVVSDHLARAGYFVDKPSETSSNLIE